ncbi:hypothetical protein RF11_07885 [Thelohanellus kitauei]|uniref:Uncharacterized protein n=1 Tax=Thelohanellus kitauei TaxID=669202 RepID=A0A0C2MFR3_THEKT|nr:hypothetical protein RF11_07885 [Thelohanellus kitauei]
MLCFFYKRFQPVIRCHPPPPPPGIDGLAKICDHFYFTLKYRVIDCEAKSKILAIRMPVPDKLKIPKMFIQTAVIDMRDFVLGREYSPKLRAIPWSNYTISR